MFSNFEKAFEKTKNEIPSEVLDVLSEVLPMGFKYEDIGEGFCTVTPISKEFDITVYIEVPKDLPSNVTYLNLLEYMYRTQKSLTVLPDKDGFITISGTKIKLAEFISRPLQDGNMEGKYIITPAAFPPPFKTFLEGKGVKKEIVIQRQPYNEMQKMLFKNIDDSILKFSYVVNEEKHSITFSFDIEIEKAHTIAEIVEALKLYEAFLKKDIKFATVDLYKHAMQVTDKEFNAISETINYWERIKRLEEYLQVSFIPEFPITHETALQLEKLYRSFIDQKPYKQFGRIDKITTTLHIPIDDKTFPAEGTFYVVPNDPEIQTIWGASLSLYSVVGLFGIRIKGTKLVNSKENIYDLLTEPTIDQSSYISIRYYLTREEATQVPFDVDLFRNADVISLDNDM